MGPNDNGYKPTAEELALLEANRRGEAEFLAEMEDILGEGWGECFDGEDL